MKTKIVHIIDNLLIGGAERQLALFCANINREKYEQVVVCMREGGPLEGKIRQYGIPIIILGKKHKIDPLFFFRLIKVLRKAKPNILHCWLFSANLWGRLSSFFVPRMKVIATERVEGQWKKFYHRIIDRILYYLKTDILLANSRGVIKYCVENEKISPKKIRLVFNAVSSKPRIKRKIPARDYRKVVSISRLTQQKGVDNLIEVADKMVRADDSVRFYIYGEGDERDIYKDVIKKKGLSKRVFLPGKERVGKIMGDADLFVSSSNYEGLPNAIMEAMSFGLPIVGTNIGGTNELIENGKSGVLVEIGNNDEMSEKAIQLLRNPEFAEKMGNIAQMNVYQNFFISDIVDDLEGVYEELIPFKDIRSKTLEANLSIHKKESPLFDLIHPELFEGIESAKNQSDIEVIRRRIMDVSPLAIDIGAGTGRITLELLKKDFQVKAVDLSPDMLSLLRQKVKGYNKIEIINQEAESFLKDFEIPAHLICFSAVLHHIANYEKALKRAIELLKPGGVLFINHEPVLRENHKKKVQAFWIDKLDSILFRTWLLLFKRKFLPVTDYRASDPFGVKGLDEEAIIQILKENHFEIISFDKYAPRKTKLASFLDQKLIKSNHQFRIVAQKPEK